MIKSLFAEADVADSLGRCPTPFQQLLPLKRLRAKNAVICWLDPASLESNDQVEELQIWFQAAFIVKSASGFVRMQHNKH